ncbi:unnamed protein product [Adineta ricciae]|nr:unnamed protein product [Adineta ricciae]
MLYHIGTRDMSTLEEIDVDIGVRKPRSFPFSQLSECLQYVNKMSPMEGEGIVACDVRTYHRIKIKSPSYLLIHSQTVGIKNQNNVRQFCLNIWLQGEKQEYLSYFPQYVQDYDLVENELEQSIIPNIIDEFTKLYSNDSKEFFRNLNRDYPSSGKPDQDRKRQIFTNIFHQCFNDDWLTFDDERKRAIVRNIFKQRNRDNPNKFIFEKYLSSVMNFSVK